ncbi:hypothetical protein DFY03_24140, partial [Escherichia coli]|nr:hypothetical protein [Escherichia coli]
MKKESGNTLKRSLLSVLVTSALCTPHAMAAFTPSVPNGETVTGEVVENGGQFVYGTASDTIINDGGYQEVEYGGTASDTIINNGGSQVVSNGGSASVTTINDGGTLDVRQGGSATGVQQNTGAALKATTHAETTVSGTNEFGEFFIENGRAENILLENGGKLIVVDASTATGTVIRDGGVQDVFSGWATGTTIDNGGKQNVYGGGTASNTIINNGGSQAVYGTASNTIIN